MYDYEAVEPAEIYYSKHQVETLLKLEREICAKICESFLDSGVPRFGVIGIDCAKAIRNQGYNFTQKHQIDPE